MERESILGAMGKFMMESGIRGLSMDMESGEDSTMIHILVSGGILKLKAMESILGRMETGMRESGNAA